MPPFILRTLTWFTSHSRQALDRCWEFRPEGTALALKEELTVL